MNKVKKIPSLNIKKVVQETTPTPSGKTDGVLFCPEVLTETLTQLNQIFDKHHKKYGSRFLWRKAIIENLAAWKLGIKI